MIRRREIGERKTLSQPTRATTREPTQQQTRHKVRLYCLVMREAVRHCLTQRAQFLYRSMYEYDFIQSFKEGRQVSLYYRNLVVTNKPTPLVRTKIVKGREVEITINYPTQQEFETIYQDDSMKRYIVRTEIQEPESE